MSDTKHTPEPWKIDEHENHFFIMRRWGGGVEPGKSSVFGSAYGAHIGSLEFVGDTAVPTRKQAEANARRIVACVNACKGMADPEKEFLSLRAEIDRAYSMLEAHNVPRERAKSIANGIDVLTTRYGKAETCWNMERAALRAAAEKARNRWIGYETALEEILKLEKSLGTAFSWVDLRSFKDATRKIALAALEEVLK